MDPSLIEDFIFKTIVFITCLAAVLYVFTKTISENTSKAVEPEPEAKPEQPAEPEKHGGVKCDGCGKDDPDRKAYINEGCKHVVCDRCVSLTTKAGLLKSLRLCPDHVHRVRLWDLSCKVCDKKGGYLKPYKIPSTRRPPTVNTAPSLYRSPGSMVEVVVGAKTTSCEIFTAPENILAGRSKTLARRLQGHTNSSREKRLKLPDHDHVIFGYVLEFMYFGKITNEPIGKDSKPTIYDFCDIWALATFLEMDELCNYCAWSILTQYDATRQLDLVKLCAKYSAKDAGELMKKLVVSFLVWTEEGMRRSWGEGCSNQLLAAVTNEMIKRITTIPSQNPLDKVENYYISAPTPPPPPATHT